MTDSSGVAREQAFQLIVEKRDQLLTERAGIRNQRELLDTRDRAIDRDLADCVAAARVFGYSLELPKDQPEQQKMLAWESVLNRPLFASLDVVSRVRRRREVGEVAQLIATEMPKIRDIVLDRLKAAEAGGTRAMSIRKYIVDTYHKDIHEKTVGMTLYRLVKEGLAHRVGHVWFFGPDDQSATKNPGAATPGSTQPVS